MREGTPLQLTGKAFDILTIFAENPGRLLDKDELIDKVWHGSFVEEGNLARNVSTLRKTLGDDGKTHKYIATVQGRGYRFIADVNVIAGEPENGHFNGLKLPAANGDGELVPENRPLDAAPAARKPLADSPPLPARVWMLMPLAAIAVLVVVGLQTGFLPSNGARNADFSKIRQVRLTQSGNVISPVLSPDGQYLVYFAFDGKEPGLSLRQMATGSVLRLLPSDGASACWAIAIAPDSSFVYYILKQESSEFGSLYRIPLLGGTARKLVERADGGLAVSPDGESIAFTRIDREVGRTSVFIISSDGSNERAISSVDLESLYQSIDWAPDGQTILYALKRHGPDRDLWHIAEIPADGGRETQIGDPSETRIVCAKWLPDKSGIIVNAVDPATRQPQLYYVSYPDGARRQITNGTNGMTGISVAASGRSILTGQSSSHRQIWTVPLGGGTPARQVSSGTEKHFDAVAWAAENVLVYDEDANSSYDHYNIWRVDPAGGKPQQITFGSSNNYQPAVAPDGKRIAFVSSRTGKKQIWLTDAEGKQFQQLTDIVHSVSEPQFSSDGQIVYFTAAVAGQNQLWRVPAAGGEAAPVIAADVFNMWTISPDQSRAAYVFFDRAAGRHRTAIRRLGEAEPELILDIRPETWMAWTPDGNAIWYNNAADDSRNVWRQPLNGSPPGRVTNFPTEKVFRCALSPAGTNLACIRHNITFDAVLLQLEQPSVP